MERERERDEGSQELVKENIPGESEVNFSVVRPDNEKAMFFLGGSGL